MAIDEETSDPFDARSACPQCGATGANKYRHDERGHITYSGGIIVGCLACGIAVHVFEPRVDEEDDAEQLGDFDDIMWPLRG
jgi:hypothetical protein